MAEVTELQPKVPQADTKYNALGTARQEILWLIPQANAMSCLRNIKTQVMTM